MTHRALGTTGLRVSALGFGAGPLGDARLDTAPSYGSSEDRLGRALAIDPAHGSSWPGVI